MIHSQDKLSDFILTGSRPKALSWLYAAISTVAVGYSLLLTFCFMDQVSEEDTIAILVFIFLFIYAVIGAFGLFTRRKYGLVMSSGTFLMAAILCVGIVMEGSGINLFKFGSLRDVIGKMVIITFNLGAFAGLYLVFRKDIKNYYSIPRWLFIRTILMCIIQVVAAVILAFLFG